MFEQLYFVSLASLGMGIIVYSIVAYRLSLDIRAGLIPTRLEEKKAKAS